MRLTITKQVGFLFLLPACGALAALGFFYSFFARSAHDDNIINVAGRQRMLSEQIGGYAYMVSIGQEEDRTPLRGFIARFEETLEVIERGGRVTGRDLPPAPPEVQDEIAHVRRLWGRLRPALTLVADRPSGDPEARASYALVASAIPRLTEASDRVVSAFEERIHVRRRRLLYLLAVVAGVDILLLISGVWIMERYIAENHRAEKALREQEERFRSVLQSAPDGVVVADSGGNICFWNRGAQALFGYAEEEALGSPLTLLIPERYRDAHQKAWERLRTTGAPRIIGKTVELHGLRKDGGEFPLELSLATWEAAEGPFYSAIIRDVTERKQIEEAQRQVERTRVLVEAAGAAAHEINQPLTAVIGFAQLLLLNAAPDDPSRRDLEMIHEAGQKIREIVSKMQNIQEYATRPYTGDARIVDFGAASRKDRES